MDKANLFTSDLDQSSYFGAELFHEVHFVFFVKYVGMDMDWGRSKLADLARPKSRRHDAGHQVPAQLGSAEKCEVAGYPAGSGKFLSNCLGQHGVHHTGFE